MSKNEEGFVLKQLPTSIKDGGSGSGPDEGVEAKPMTRDEVVLARYGKRQQFKRNFRIISIVGLTSTLMITWEGILIVFSGGFKNGGPTGLVGGFLLSWFGNIAQVLVMAELGSMIPLSGGAYNWVAILAPRSIHKFLSYITGWITFIAWQACTASGVLLCGTMVQGLVVLNKPDFEAKAWQATLMFYAVIAMVLFINTYLARLLPSIEVVFLVIHCLGFFGVLIPLVYLGQGNNDTAGVFQTFFNGGLWSTNGLSFFVGSVSTMFAFVGVDGATHMAEEIQHADTVIPASMIITVLMNGGLGFAMLIATLYVIGDADAALSTPTGYPIMAIFTQAVGSKSGGLALSAVITVVMFFAAIGFLPTASRMLWAFAREKGFPFSSYVARVDSRWGLPLWAIGVTAFINLLLALINIGSTVAFNAFTGLSVAAFYTSFSIAALCMLHKRLTTPHSDIRWGPFKLGRFGVPVTIIAVLYSAIGTFFSFWPPDANPTVETMNWSCVIFVGVLFFAVVHWFAFARHTYKGPIMEVRLD
ncbi:amino acid/polyamine transporter I [Geopyxis carbonaria]|nr:amino acid/polyamine transporter I [Geopyxis carbonaria]